MRGTGRHQRRDRTRPQGVEAPKASTPALFRDVHWDQGGGTGGVSKGGGWIPKKLSGGLKKHWGMRHQLSTHLQNERACTDPQDFSCKGKWQRREDKPVQNKIGEVKKLYRPEKVHRGSHNTAYRHHEVRRQSYPQGCSVMRSKQNCQNLTECHMLETVGSTPKKRRS